MKKGLKLFILLVMLSGSGFSQEKIDTTLYKKPLQVLTDNVRVFIPGYRDTIMYADKRHAQTLSILTLLDGFELKLTDTTYKILQFGATFDAGNTLYSGLFNHNKMVMTSGTEVFFQKIRQATLLSIDRILITKNNQYYRAEPLVYIIIPDPMDSW